MSSAITPTASPPHPVRWLLPVLIGYAVLALLSGVLHRPEIGYGAAALLLIAAGVPLLRRRTWAGICVWLLLVALMIAAGFAGHMQLVLSGLPILILAAVAWVFARTLKRGREPLIARCVRVIEDDQRLELPGVKRYARGVTLFWAGLLGLQAVVLSVLWIFAAPGGLLVALGLPTPLALPRDALAWYPEAGCWLVFGVAFMAEYAFRRWALRRLPHPTLKRFVTRLVQRWPQLLRDEVSQ